MYLQAMDGQRLPATCLQQEEERREQALPAL